MQLYRMYLDEELHIKKKINITHYDKIHYIKNVIKLHLGSTLRVFNKDYEFDGRIIHINHNSITIQVINLVHNNQEKLKIILALGIIKTKNMLTAIDMAVQLGVTDIIPVITQYSQFKSVNNSKINKIIIKATEQSTRISLPILHNVADIDELIKLRANIYIIFNENEKEHNDINICKNISQSNHIVIILGPEGGFHNDEITLLKSFNNSYSVSLGKYKLRTETAVCAALSQLQLIINNVTKSRY